MTHGACSIPLLMFGLSTSTRARANQSLMADTVQSLHLLLYIHYPLGDTTARGTTDIERNWSCKSSICKLITILQNALLELRSRIHSVCYKPFK